MVNINVFKGILFSFGYTDFSDFMHSNFVTKGTLSSTFLLSITFSTIFVQIEQFIGLHPLAYLSFILFFILEFATGVAASVWIKKEKFQSLKMGRIVLKIFVYSIILGLMNIFSKEIGGHAVAGIEFNFFEWIYFLVINILILQLLVSVLENCEILGIKEVSIFLRIFRKRIKKIETKASGDEESDLQSETKIE